VRQHAPTPARMFTGTDKETTSPQEVEPFRVLDAYATGIVTALTTDGVQPFIFATIEARQMLEEIDASLQHLLKKGGL